ncbi:MAG: TonB-dependent receptor [Pseudomonadota bacterium]
MASSAQDVNCSKQLTFSPRLNHPVFKRSALAASVAAAISGSVAVYAQEQDSVIEEVVVVGIRGSLQSALDTKRNAVGIVDAISAEDIGKFPDTNLAESLQRVTGVSIDRANNEGNKVTVRGFGPEFNLVTLNGRQMPSASSLDSAGIPRSFNFREIAAESVSGVEVYKTGRSNIFSGGIGATINMRSARPFDFPGFKSAISAKGVFDTSVEEGSTVTPEISGLISQTFADGKFGILFSASIADRDSRQDRVGTQLGGWRRNPFAMDTSAVNTANNPDLITFAPFTAEVDIRDFERERENAQLVLQFAPTDNFVATIDYVASRFDERIDMNRHGLWFDNPTNAVATENGSLSSATFTPGDLDFWAFDFVNNNELDSVGVNLEWEATESLSFVFDAHHSVAESNPDGDFGETIANIHNPSNSPVVIDVDFSGDIPTIDFDDSAFPGGVYDSANRVSDLFQKRGRQIENTITQLQFSGAWKDVNGGPLTQINFGVAYTDYETDHQDFGTFSFVDIDLTGLDFTFESIGDTADEFGAGGAGLFPQIQRYDAGQFIDLVEQQGQFFLNPPTVDGVTEETLAAFVSLDFDLEFNGMPVRINAGVRFEDTDVDTFSLLPGITALNFRNAAELQPRFTEEVTRNALSGGYTSVLPNLDFGIDITDQLVGRVSYSRTLGRASVQALFPSTANVVARPGGPFDASQGNPGLLPLESDNFDFALEYYYGEASVASIGYFRKYVENFFGATFEQRPILDFQGNPLTDPSVNPRPGCPDPVEPPNSACLGQPGDPVATFNVSTTGNLDDEEIDGWELNIQHLFGDTGFGAILNYTLVDGTAEFDPTNFETAEGLAGLSDSANVVGFYEKGPWQVRAAYNWRDEFLLTFTGFGEPVITEAYGQLDFNAAYNINDTTTVFVEGLNVLEETIRRHGRFDDQLIDALQFGARFNIGVRATF